MLDHKQLVEIAVEYAKGERGGINILAEPKVPGVAECPDVLFWSRSMDSTIIEIKCSLSDLRADASKPFRHNRDGMGLFRYFMWEKGGEIRAEHIDDDTGFGGLQYDPSTGQTSQVKPCAPLYAARSWINELAALNHYLSLATREAGKSAGECRKSAQGKIPAKFHDDIRKLVAAGGACPSRFIAREICKLMPRDGVGKVSKWLVDDIRAGRIKGLKAEGNPAEITIAA